MSDTTTRRGPYAKTKGRRSVIAAAALQLVKDKGYQNVTIAEVSRSANLTEAQVLYRFPSKDHLLVAALEYNHQLSYEKYEHAIESLPGELQGPINPEAQLAEVTVAGMQSPNVHLLECAMRVQAADPAHPAHEWALSTTTRTCAIYAKWCEGLIRVGWAHPDTDPDRFALQFLVMWSGLTEAWLIDPTLDLTGELAAAVRVLTRRDAVLAKEALENAMSHI